MTEKRKISQLPVLQNFTGDEYFLVAYNGRSHKVTTNSLVSFFTGGIDLDLLEQIREAVAGIPSVEGLVTAEQLQTALAGLDIPSIEGLATNEQVTAAIAAAVEGLEAPAVDLSDYPTKSEVTSEIRAAVDAVEFPVVDLEPFVTHTQMNERLAELGHGNSETIDLSVYATKTEVTEAIAAIEIPEAQDISGLATKQEVQEGLANIQVPSVEGLASQEYVDQAIAAIEQPAAGVSQEQLDAAIEGLAIPSVEGLASQEYVDAAIAAIEHPESGVTQEQLDSAIEAIQIPSIEGLATEEYVREAIDGQTLPSVEGLASEEYVDQAIAAIPSIEGLASEEYVDRALSTAVTGLATEQYVNDAIAAIETSTGGVSQEQLDAAVEGLATEEYVADAAAASAANVNAYVAQAVAGLASQEYVDSAIAAIEIPSTEGFVTEAGLNESISEFVTNESVETMITNVGQNINALHNMLMTAPGNILWVGANNSETQNGSYHSPFVNIQDAIDVVPTDGKHYLILVAPGARGVQNVTIAGGGRSITIQGFGCNDSHITQINGTVGLIGSELTRFRMKDMSIKAPQGQEALTISGTAGRHFFQNVTIEKGASSDTNSIVGILNDKNWIVFSQCAINGIVDMNGASDNNSIVYFNDNNGDTDIINQGYSTIEARGGKLGSVFANGGDGRYRNLFLTGDSTGQGIINNGTGSHYAAFCDFRRNDGTYSRVQNLETFNCNVSE